VLVAGCATQRTDSTLNGARVEEDVRSFLAAWNDAVAAGDHDAIRASYVAGDRLRWFEDGVLRYQSADEVVAAIDAFPPGTEVETDLSDVRIDAITASVAYGSAAFETLLTFPDGEFQFSGVFTMLLERTDRGWVMTAGHTSSIRTDGR